MQYFLFHSTTLYEIIEPCIILADCPCHMCHPEKFSVLLKGYKPHCIKITLYTTSIIVSGHLGFIQNILLEGLYYFKRFFLNEWNLPFSYDSALHQF